MKKNVYRFVKGVYLFLLFVLCYITYYIYNLHGFSVSKEIQLYYTGISLCAVSLCVVLMLSDKIKVDILLTISTLIISVYVADIFLYFGGFVSAPHLKMNVVRKAESEGVPYDKRSRYEVLKDLRKVRDAWPVVFPKLWIKDEGIRAGESTIFPLGSVSNTHQLYCNESGSYVSYDSDQYGFNNPKEAYKNEITEIVLVGDSFIEGACVDNIESIAGQLLFFGHTVLNYGKGGNGPYLNYAVFKEYVEMVKPKYVVWSLFDNDFVDFEGEKGSATLANYFKNGFTQNLAENQNIIDVALKNYIEDAESRVHQSSAARFLKLWHIRFFLRDRLVKKENQIENLNDNTEEIAEIVRSVNERVRAWGGKLIFLYLPSRETLAQQDTVELSFARSLISRLNSEESIVIINMFEAFTLQPKSSDRFFPFGLEHHYNGVGYKLVAENLSNVIQKK